MRQEINKKHNFEKCINLKLEPLDQKATETQEKFMKKYWDNKLYKEYLHSCGIQRFLIKSFEKEFYQYFISIQYKKEIPKSLEISKEFENLIVLLGPVYLII